jgi:hypothetical protein
MTLVAGVVSPAAGVAGVHGFLTLERTPRASDGGFSRVKMSFRQLLSCSHHDRFWCRPIRATRHTDET